MPTARRLTEAEKVKRARVLARLEGDCIYCGDKASTTDHFKPVVALNGLPTGYCSDAWNVVPCCITCNSSKSNDSWRKFMSRTNGKAPKPRGIKRIAERRVVLEAYDRLHRLHAQKWDPDAWTKQLQYLRTSMKAAFTTHARRTSKLRLRIRRKSFVSEDAVLTRSAKRVCRRNGTV